MNKPTTRHLIDPDHTTITTNNLGDPDPQNSHYQALCGHTGHDNGNAGYNYYDHPAIHTYGDTCPNCLTQLAHLARTPKTQKTVAT